MCEDYLKSQVKSKISPCRDGSLSIPFALYRETIKLTDFFSLSLLHFILYSSEIAMPCYVVHYISYVPCG